MENKESTNSLERKTKVIYELGADVSFDFDNGETIRISKTVLALHTEFLNDVFFGPSPATNFKVKIFDSDTFRTFLDCLFELKEYSILNSLLIYPVAHQYQVKESLEKCVAVLEPKVMDENVPLILNLALFYKDDKIVNNVIDFLKTENGIVDFMENVEYRNLLEPTSMCKLIEHIQFDSFVWKLIYEWGENHLEKQCKSVDVCSFFKEIGIFSKIELDHFESAQAIFDFHKMSNLQFLDSNKILWYLESRMLDSKTKLPDKSEWIKLGEGETLSETITFTNPFCISREDGEISHRNGVSIEIHVNKVFFENFKKNDHPVLEIKAEYWCKRVSARFNTNLSCWCDDKDDCLCMGRLEFPSFGPRAVKQTDLNNFSNELVFRIHVQASDKELEMIKSVKIKYRFRNIHKSRILKTTLNGREFAHTDGLYFTKNVVIYPN